MLKRSVYRIVLLVVVVIALLGLPMAAGAQSANGITSVKDGATVSGKVEIKGNANDPRFSRWQLDLLPGAKADAAIFLATDTKSGPFSYTLDTTPYPNGDHALRLRVVRPDGNYDEYITKVTIANPVAKSIVAAVDSRFDSRNDNNGRDDDNGRNDHHFDDLSGSGDHNRVNHTDRHGNARARGQRDHEHKERRHGDGHGRSQGECERSELLEVAVGSLARRRPERSHLPGVGYEARPVQLYAEHDRLPERQACPPAARGAARRQLL